MKRLLLITPLLVVLVGCAGPGKDSMRPTLSRSAHLGEVPLRLDVTGVHRTGDVAALDLRLVNRAPRGGDAFDIDDTFSREGNYDLGGVLLVDSGTGRELDPLDDNADLAFTQVAGGGTQSLRVAFPAPRGKSVDILVPHFGLFRNVPVH